MIEMNHGVKATVNESIELFSIKRISKFKQYRSTVSKLSGR